MLGICFIEKGMPKLAVKWFEKGLQAQGRTEAEYLGLRYDLASALEASGENARALEIFTELYGQDAGFRQPGFGGLLFQVLHVGAELGQPRPLVGVRRGAVRQLRRAAPRRRPLPVLR